MLAPDFRLDNHVTAVADDVYWGERGLREWKQDMLSVFEAGALYSIDGIIQAGPECVVAAYSISGRSRFSGEQLDFSWTGVTWFSHGEVVRAATYHSAAHALEAAGLHAA